MLVAPFILRKPGGRPSKHLNLMPAGYRSVSVVVSAGGCFLSSQQRPRTFGNPKVDCEICTAVYFEIPQSRLRNSHDVCVYVRLFVATGASYAIPVFPIVVWLVWPPFPCSGGHHQRSGRCLAVEGRRVHRQPGLPQVEGPAAAGRVSNACLTS